MPCCAQPPDSKAPPQEKLHTTTFSERAANGAQPRGYYATQPGQPIVIRTRQLREPAAASSAPGSADNATDSGSRPLGTAGDGGSTYPGLEAYERMLGEGTTTTALFTAAPAATQHSAGVADPPDRNPAGAGDPGGASVAEVPVHRPPTRNVGSTDERDVIASSMEVGVSPKDLVDSIRRELTSLSGQLSSNGEAARAPRPTANGAAKPVKKPRKSSYLDS